MAPKNIAWGLLLLRLGLGIFVILCSIDKFISPVSTIHFFSQYYGLDINASIGMLLGAVQLVLGLFMLLGMYKFFTYGLGFFLQALSTILIFRNLPTLFGENHLFILSCPILFSFLTLFLLRDLDTKLTLGKKKTLFT
jgi:putative oxidoreductase